MSREALLADRGGHFYRTDLQVHTPRDAQWSGPRPANRNQREAWAAALVRAARAAGLHAIAISDHHDFANFPLVKAAAAAELDANGEMVAEPERLVVFPGLELTLEVPCQAILVLDADFPTDRLRDVLTVLKIEPVDEAKPKCPQAQVISGSGDINQLLDELDRHEFLRGRYILLPHVTPDGHKTLLKSGFHTKYATMRAVGGYLDGSVDVLAKPVHSGKVNVLDGGDPEWGSKRITVFQTSDSREHDFAKLGASATWIKWASPTAEAIRQACLAQESRISQTEPGLPAIWISRIAVTHSKFLGRFDLALNPQYTALIGGRGTGKSTVLDYARWALCDQPTSSAEDDEVANPRARQAKLIEATLAPYGGQVEVHFVINGIAHVVRRNGEDGSVRLKVGDSEFRQVREADVQSLLPIHAYSQKQLSSVAIRNDELVRFITAPIRAVLDEIDRQVLDTSDRLRENYGTLQRYRSLSGEVRRSELRVSSLADQARALRESLGGLDAADQEVLSQRPALDDARSTVERWAERLQASRSALEEARSALGATQMELAPEVTAPEAVSPELGELRRVMAELLTSTLSAVDSVAQELDAAVGVGGSVAVARDQLAAKLSGLDDRYAEVVARSSAHQRRLEELDLLERQQREMRELLQRQRRDLESLGDPLARHAELRQGLLAARARRSEVLVAQCESLFEASDGLIKATLSTGKAFSQAIERFRSLISGSRVRASKVERFFDELAKDDDPLASWESVLGELEWLMLRESDAEIRTQDTPTLSRLSFELGDQQRVISAMTPEGWLDLSLAAIGDQPEFYYRAKEDDYIAFGAASAGQQASALLTVLLAQSGMPLLIDQPEEDLDSATVELIVRRIWDAKARRQLIFASHNANLVVNGDADLVAVCAYVEGAEQSAGRIACEGAIDVPRVRKSITSVMEGGERAFKLRKEKYGF